MARGKNAIPYEIWVLVAAAFIIALGFGLIAPIIPEFARSFDVSMAAASAIVSVFALSRLIFAPATGGIIDRLGSRKVYLTGLIIVGVTTGAIAFAQDYWHMLLCRALGGFGSTMFTVSAMGLIVRLAPPNQRGRASSLYATAFLLGNVLGPVIGAAASAIGMRAPFFIYGTGVLFSAALVWKLLDPKKISEVEHANDFPPMTFGEAVKSSSYRASLASGFANGWINIGCRVAILPLLAASMFDRGAAVSGIALAAFALGNAVAQQFSGRGADRIGRKPLIMTGLVVNLVFTGFLGWSQAFWEVLVLSLVAGVGAGMLNPAQQAVVADVIGNKRSGGKVLANFQMAQDLGSIIGPVLAGALVDISGYKAAFTSCAVVGLIATIAWLWGQETLASKVHRKNRIARENNS
ncbi:hypothetical protein HMPREF1219_00277 [Corynebacterium pyruviciproducens ATCC BAA-1742]|uniref:Major facilitator superfamily (MFS) profile domain-containing protein n=1 Tax=Corynebacterium pyruviciproducens ATCC BAA-1742 TaxID=1125779 RepID=S2ZLW9_9CORY|nr:MFS transporter [Corynebacterium pyruviciproducens]EPD70982.1 hypothetical protein HMPREF1219_00277 [Corynebacterium pyruviciproducens ATCC BAA-1742]